MKKGDRVEVNELGLAQGFGIKNPSRLGTVQSVNEFRCYVKWDGRWTVDCVHPTLLRVVEDVSPRHPRGQGI